MSLALNNNDVARAFLSRQVTHPEGQNEDKNDESLRRNKEKIMEIWAKMRNEERLPTWDCEDGY